MNDRAVFAWGNNDGMVCNKREAISACTSTSTSKTVGMGGASPSINGLDGAALLFAAALAEAWPRVEPCADEGGGRDEDALLEDLVLADGVGDGAGIGAGWILASEAYSGRYCPCMSLHQGRSPIASFS